MTGDKLKEFMRRLATEGYNFDLDINGVGTIRNGEQERVTINEDGEILFKPENRRLAYEIRDLRDEVDEYMTEFAKAAPDKDRLPGRADTRTLMLYNGCELAGRQMPDGVVDFVTWAHVRGDRQVGHYFSDYTAAKQDFAVRAGLIDRDRLFTETELTVIRSNLSDFLTIDSGSNLTWDEEDAIKDIISKINDVVAPAIQERAQEAEDHGYEPEQEL